MSRGTGTGLRTPWRAGFTLIEVVVILMVVGIIVGTAMPRYTDYRNRIVPQHAAQVVGGFVALTRAYALQSRENSTLLVDPTNLTATIRVDGDTIRTLDLGPGSDFEVDTLDMDMAGDSITFTARGICLQCGMGGTAAIVIAARGTSYVVTFNAVGTWKRELR